MKEQVGVRCDHRYYDNHNFITITEFFPWTLDRQSSCLRALSPVDHNIFTKAPLQIPDTSGMEAHFEIEN